MNQPSSLDFADLASSGHYIGGAFQASAGSETIAVIDPATGDQIGAVPAADASDVDAAVAAARTCFDTRTWMSVRPNARAEAMWKLSDLLIAHEAEFAEIEVRDNGMPMAFARRIVGRSADVLRYYAGMATKIHGLTSDVSIGTGDMHAYSLAEPVGVVGAITPWNGPIVTLVSKIAPAIAAGCSVVAKPAEQTPLSALRFARLVQESGLFPDGLINIVNGHGRSAGAALVDHPGVDKISFTGSTEVGKGLIRASASDLKRVTLELGGKSPIFVFDDADLDKAIMGAAMAIFANSGQVCFAGSRLYVQRGIYDRVVEGVAEIARNLKLGSGMDPASQLGPLVSKQQMERVLSYDDAGIDEGAELITGGARVAERGYFVAPTVFANRSGADIRIAREEIFGPVLTAMPFDGLDDVARLANATPYGLGGGIFTSNVSTAHVAAKLIRSGNIWINCYGGTDLSLPFGGFKQSGWGREGGHEGIAPFLESKAVYLAL
jgi:phenylacetaldehyde dehydrogenase